VNSQPHITFHPFADGAALHRKGSHRLWVLNTSSAVLWCLLEEHGDTAALVSAYAAHFKVSLDQSREDVKRCLQHFAVSGLLGSDRAMPMQSDPLPVKASSTSPFASGFSYAMADSAWQISCANPDLTKKTLACFSHLASDAIETDLQFSLEESATGWTLSSRDRLIQTGLGEDQWLPWLMADLFQALCAKQADRLLLHAAVLVRDGLALLLPAAARSGKSTLSMALSAAGWKVYSDELAPVDPATLQVGPFPLPVGIKHRSVAALSPWFPGLGEIPAHRRADGQLVRYLGGAELALAPRRAAPVDIQWLIFPRYDPASKTTLRQLEPLAALELLAATGSSQRPLRECDIEALLQLAGERDSFLLEYADLQAAVRLVDAAAQSEADLSYKL
jgi:Coenzyme PQQ synthesis protein D (PqqD)